MDLGELVLTHDEQPVFIVSLETQYFGEPFEPGPSRPQWIDRTA